MNRTNRNQTMQQFRQLIDEIGATTSLSQLLGTHYQNRAKPAQVTTDVPHCLRSQEPAAACGAELPNLQDISSKQPGHNQATFVLVDLGHTESTTHLHLVVNLQNRGPSSELHKLVKKCNKINRKLAKALAKQTGLKMKV